MKDKVSATDKCEAVTSYNTQPSDSLGIEGHYHAVCYDAAGNVKWEELKINMKLVKKWSAKEFLGLPERLILI